MTRITWNNRAGIGTAYALSVALWLGAGARAGDAEPAKEKPAPQTPAAEAPLRKGDLVRMDIRLPKPMFIGTPKNIRTPNLEPDRKGKLRPAYYAPEGVKLISVGKPVTSSEPDPLIGEIKFVTDGRKKGSEGFFVELSPGKQYVQIDLENVREIHAIVMWHYHSQARVYRDVVVQLSKDDPDFILSPVTVFNNDHDNSSGFGIGRDHEYIETFEGRLAPVKGAKARYVRLYSNGSTANEMNHYVEVEVYGK